MRRERLDDLRARLRGDALERGINPRDVDVLLSDLTARPLAWLLAHGETLIDPKPLLGLLQRRYDGEPLQYIRGKAEFFSRTFDVDDRVLIPRPETEIVVESAIRLAPKGGRVVDIGTGSGCIAISLERERPDLHVLGVDPSIEALAVAARNRRRLASKVMLAGSDVLTAIRAQVDLVVSNPPYVPIDEYETLAVEVRIHEPRMAITPGGDGLRIIERIFGETRPLLAPGGGLVMEVGYGQEEAVRRLAATQGYRIDEFVPDLAGIPRVVISSLDDGSRELPLLPDRQ